MPQTHTAVFVRVVVEVGQACAGEPIGKALLSNDDTKPASFLLLLLLCHATAARRQLYSCGTPRQQALLAVFERYAANSSTHVLIKFGLYRKLAVPRDHTHINVGVIKKV
ncbi:unnamed protein product [Laminaria digitata]